MQNKNKLRKHFCAAYLGSYTSEEQSCNTHHLVSESFYCDLQRACYCPNIATIVTETNTRVLEDEMNMEQRDRPSSYFYKVEDIIILSDLEGVVINLQI